MNNFQKYIIYALLLFPPIVFFTDLTRNPYYFQIFLLNVLILFFWIVHLLRAFKSGSIKWIFSPLDKPLLSFCIFASFTWLYAQFAGQSYHIPEAIEHGKALPGFGMDYLRSSIFSEGSKKFMFTLVNMLMAYWITAVFVPVSFNRQEKEKFLNTTWGLLFFVGFIAAFYGLLQYFEIEFVWGKVLNPFGGRPVSTFGNPNFMSSYLLILFSVAIHYYLSAGTSKVKRFIVLVALVTYFYAIVSTMTRSTWVGLFVAVGIIFAYLVLKGRDILAREIKWLVALALFMAVGFLLWPKSTGGYKTISRITEIGSAATRPYGPVHQRLMIYSSAWDMVRDKPVIGRGWGLFELFYPFYQGKYFFNKIYRQFRTHANNAHNEVLEIWSQTGTIGLGLYLWFLTTMVVYGFKIASGLPEEKKLFPVVVTAGAVGMFVDNFFGNVSIHFCVPAFLYWWNMGVLSQLDDGLKIKEYKLKGQGKAGILVLIVFFLFLILRWYNFYMGEINYFSGFKLAKRNDVSLAIKFLENAHRHNSEVNSEYELANSYARLNIRDKALVSYYNALSANCGYDEIYFNLATVYNQMGELDKAILNYTQALYINPVSQEGYQALGNIFLPRINEFMEPAAALFEQAVQLFPDNIDFWNALGFIYMRKGNNAGAVKAYRKALELNPEIDITRENLRNALAMAGVKSDPLLEYGDVLSVVEQKIQQKKWQEVIVLSRKLIELSPESFKAHFYLANGLLTTGKINESIVEYREALRFSPGNTSVLANLGVAYAHSGAREEARETFKRILEIEPQNAAAQENLNKLRTN